MAMALPVILFGCTEPDDNSNGQETQDPAKVSATIECDDEAFNDVYLNVLVKVETNGEEVLGVELFLDGKSQARKVLSPYSFSIPTKDMKTGKHELTGTLTMADGTTKTPAKSFILSVRLGTEYQGGIVVKTSDNGLHGVIASKQDLKDNRSGLYTYGSARGGYEAYSMTDGYANTMKFEGKPDYGYAAIACLLHEEAGYNDWYLPAHDEYILFEPYRELLNIPVRGGNIYWSSTGRADNTLKAYAYSFGAAIGNPFDVSKELYARPCRRF